jgi:hypothetical protein
MRDCRCGRRTHKQPVCADQSGATPEQRAPDITELVSSSCFRGSAYGFTGGDFLSKPLDHGGLAWGTVWTSAALLAALVVLIAYQSIDIRRHPLDPVPAPLHRRTGEPQQPNGALVTQRP